MWLKTWELSCPSRHRWFLCQVFSTRFECIFPIFSTRFECVFSHLLHSFRVCFLRFWSQNRSGLWRQCHISTVQSNCEQRVSVSLCRNYELLRGVKTTLETSGKNENYTRFEWKIWNYTRFEWRRCVSVAWMDRVNPMQMKNQLTLAVKLHSERVEKMQKHNRNEWRRSKLHSKRGEKMQIYTRNEWRRCKTTLETSVKNRCAYFQKELEPDV